MLPSLLPKSLRPLLPYLKRYRWGYVAGTVCVLVSKGAWVLFPQVIQRAIDSLKGGVTRHALALFVCELLAVFAVRAIFMFLTRWILIGISRDIEFDLRNDLFARLETLSYSYYQRMRTGDVMARATNHLNAVRMFSDISARAQENFSGVRVIRAYVQEEAEIANFETANQEYIARSLRLVRLMGMLWPTLELVLGVATALVLWLGGREVINGQTRVELVSYLGTKTTLFLFGSMSVGGFAAFLTYMMQLTWPIIALGWVVNIFQRGTASLIRLNEILVEQPEITDAPEASDLPIAGEIEFRNLNFSYNGNRVLHNLNLKIPAGSSLAIVGPTGSGKTTLVNLIPRIYDAEPGTILIDGRPIHEYSLSSLRKSTGFVPQETFLFSDRIPHNIALGVDSATDQQIHDPAAAANIAEDIESFPESYQTLVGERGITLSGGQKQRTAIARALIRDPRILILDDALSSVDTHTEDKILNHLLDVLHGRTTIFISHRVSTVRNADRIAVLHGGHIVELGTHDELLALNGYYTDLYNKQLLEEELAEV